MKQDIIMNNLYYILLVIACIFTSCEKDNGVPEEFEIASRVSGLGGAIRLDLGRKITIADFTWNIAGTSVSHYSGTTYDFVIPANTSECIWKKREVRDNLIINIPSSESDPDAIPTSFNINSSERKFVGTIIGVLQVEINQGVETLIEYLGRYGSPLTSEEKSFPENIGHTRRRAIITSSDALTTLKWGIDTETDIQDIWDGRANTRSLIALGHEYKAATYCASLGDGWYLPAQNQLAGIWVAYSGLTPTTGHTHWSSTESSRNYGWSITLNSGTLITNFKNENRNVRCVKDL